MKQLCNSIIVLLLGVSFLHAAQSTLLYEEDFSNTRFGHTPEGWQDMTNLRPSRNWAVDGNGVLRQTIKNHTGLLIYAGYTLQPKPAASMGDARIEATFSKTEDDTVFFGIAGRVQDRGNYYLARFSGTRRLELMRMKDGMMTPLDAVPLPDLHERRETGVVTLQPYRSGQRWTLSLTLEQNRLTAVVRDAEGREQARLGATDDSFTKGTPGICCTRFASAASFRLDALKPVEITADAARLAKRNAAISEAEPDYPVVKAVEGVLSTPAAKLAPKYDIIIAGAGTGGWAAAVQAARLGSRVLLLEESDWIGGQMAAAGVTTMDEDSVWMKFPVRERGLYREFHESITLHYLSREKDPQVAYYGWPDQLEGGYEPKVARAVMQGFIHEAKNIDVSLGTRVSAVTKQGDTVTGTTLSFANGSTREIACTVLVDATEYGDVIPLTGARYRVGNQTSDKIDPAALVQDHTWTCIVREYPEGVPEHLIIKEPPPGYAKGSGKRYRNYTNEGVIVWGGAGKGLKGPRHWRTYFAWRGMVDSESPLIGESSHQRHTQCGFNGGNDYPVTAATIEDPAQRLLDEREGIYKTLGALYYFQHELGVNWSLAEDEGYDTPANRAKMKALNLPPDLEKIAVHLPQHPYVRECRRIIGVQTLTAHDLGRFENAKHVRTSVAMGDYFMDLDHGKTAHAIEPELDSGELPKGGGPFQVPFEVFIPEKIDGFVPAEKNISQSRIANGATRLQPITMLTGQAAGTIAALAVKQGVQPRALKPIQVQLALLESGCTLIQRWYADVPWGTELWRATQLLSLYQILDRPGDIDHENTVPLASRAKWGVELEISADEQAAALQRLKTLTGSQPALSPETRRAGDFGEASRQISRFLQPTMKHLILLLLAFSAHVFAVEPLNDAEKKRLADAERSAKSTPVMREVVAKYRAARTAYTEDRKKPATERDKNASNTYREATAVYEAALKKAILAADAALEPLLSKRAALKKIGLDKANEGESVADSASAKNDAMKPVKDDPKLPRVLLIGDSISIGYTLPTRELLKGKANVHRPPANCSSTGFGLSQLTSWLGDKKWDVIHFNFGLHDAKLPPEGVRHAPPDVYEKNLRELVQQMKATGAKLIFATTTPVPKGGNLTPTRRFGSIEEYNTIARKVMAESGVAIDDLNAVAKPMMEKHGRPTDVHFAPEGYEVLAKAVSESIEAALAKN